MSKKTRVEKSCLQCAKTFEVIPSVLKKGGGKYCSNTCKNKFLWAQPEYRNHMSEAHKGQIPTNLQELIAYTRSPEGRRKNSEANMGRPAWNKGVGLGAPYVTVGKRDFEHRIKMEQRIGRKLTSREIVHHWDENKKNNAQENLCLMRHTSSHLRLHHFARRHGIPVIELKFEQPWLNGNA